MAWGLGLPYSMDNWCKLYAKYGQQYRQPLAGQMDLFRYICHFSTLSQIMTVDDRGEGGLAYLVRPDDVISGQHPTSYSLWQL